MTPQRQPVQSAPPPRQPGYDRWARDQRLPGTVYGGRKRGAAGRGGVATYNPAGPLETSGSLTGHILAQGNVDGPTPKSRTTKVVVIMLIVLGLLVVGGLAAAILFSDAISQTLDQILRSE